MSKRSTDVIIYVLLAFFRLRGGGLCYCCKECPRFYYVLAPWWSEIGGSNEKFIGSFKLLLDYVFFRLLLLFFFLTVPAFSF